MNIKIVQHKLWKHCSINNEKLTISWWMHSQESGPRGVETRPPPLAFFPGVCSGGYLFSSEGPTPTIPANFYHAPCLQDILLADQSHVNRVWRHWRHMQWRNRITSYRVICEHLLHLLITVFLREHYPAFVCVAAQDSRVAQAPNFYRAMRMHKRGICCDAVSVRLSVTFVDHVKTNKYIFEMFSPSGSDTILVFRTKGGADIPTGTP